MPRPHITRSNRKTDRAATDMPTRARSKVTMVLAALACTCAGVATAAVAPALSPAPALAATTTAPKESVVVFEGQLHDHQVRAVTLHPKAHKLAVLLGDGRKVIVAFPPSRQQQLQSAVEGSGVTVKVVKVKPPSHKRRDIAIAVAVVLVIALAVGAWLLVRRKRLREEEYGPAGR